MPVEWTEHRFSGGVLALDVANTVVLRVEPRRSFDRFADSGEIARFAGAASRIRTEELRGQEMSVSSGEAIKPMVVALREATDELFRASVETGNLKGTKLGALLDACSAAVRSEDFSVGARQGPAVRFEAAVATSALSLLQPDNLKRIRICRNCGWLFLDRSRNASRLWCDMAVCGNRQKAKRHYLRRKGNLDA